MVAYHPWVEAAVLLLLAVSVPVALVAGRRWVGEWRARGWPASQVPELPLNAADLLLFCGVMGLLVWGSGRLLHVAAAGWTVAFLGFKGVEVARFWRVAPSVAGALGHVRESAVAYLALLPLVALAMAASLLVGRLLGWEADTQEAVRLFLRAEGFWAVAGFLALACVAAPVAEECLFRGLLYPALKTRLGRPWAMGLTSVLFGAMHGHWASFLSLTVLGLALAVAYDATGRLGRAIALHVVFNSVTCALLLASKWLSPA